MAKRLAKNGLVAFVSTTLTLGVVEGVARLLPFQSTPTMYEYDSESYFTLKPNHTAHFITQIEEDEVVSISCSTSSQGIRDRVFGPKQSGEFRIAMVGDSFTGGQALTRKQTISHHLERALASQTSHSKISVANCGVGGYAPWQERIFMNERAFPLDPNLVVLQLFPGNDLAGSLERDEKFLHAYNSQWAKNMREWKAYDSFPNRMERWAAGSSRAYAILLKKTNRQYLLLSALRMLDRTSEAQREPLPKNLHRPAFLEPELKKEYALLREAWNQYERNIVEMRDDCEKRGIGFVVYAIPHRNIVGTPAWKHFTASDPLSYDRGKSMRRTEEICERNGIPYIDLYQALMKEDDPTALYFALDWHLNPEGAAFTGKHIANELLQLENVLVRTD